MIRFLFIGLVLCVFSYELYALDTSPVITDSRIKTFVYNENDVYAVKTHYGYQSNIEFGRHERIRTVSVGDRVGWQVVPAGRRLFIKSLEENGHTNMTVVTNKRAYQFDLRSSGRVPLRPNEELVYVIRFFYPEDLQTNPNPPVFSDQLPAQADLRAQMAAPTMPVTTATFQPAPTIAPTPLNAPLPQYRVPPTMTPTPQPMASAPMPFTPMPQPNAMQNFNYTFSGDSRIAPTRIYDDGRATYFSFAPQVASGARIVAIAPDGGEIPLTPTRTLDGQVIVNMVAPKYAIYHNGQVVRVFNEQLAHMVAM